MVKAIIAFVLADAGLSLISMRVPLFGHHSKKWEKESYLQRFCNCFFLPLAIFLLCIVVMWYRDTKLPNPTERKLESKEIEYALVTSVDEIGDADIVYEIRKESSADQICQIILSICQELNREKNSLYVNCEGNDFIITENEIIIGRVTVSEKKYGLLLEFKWSNINI